METLSEPPTRDGFQLAVICALPEERDAVEKAMTRDYKGEGTFTEERREMPITTQPVNSGANPSC